MFGPFPSSSHLLKAYPEINKRNEEPDPISIRSIPTLTLYILIDKIRKEAYDYYSKSSDPNSYREFLDRKHYISYSEELTKRNSKSFHITESGKIHFINELFAAYLVEAISKIEKLALLYSIGDSRLIRDRYIFYLKSRNYLVYVKELKKRKNGSPGKVYLGKYTDESIKEELSFIEKYISSYMKTSQEFLSRMGRNCYTEHIKELLKRGVI